MGLWTPPTHHSLEAGPLVIVIRCSQPFGEGKKINKRTKWCIKYNLSRHVGYERVNISGPKYSKDCVLCYSMACRPKTKQPFVWLVFVFMLTKRRLIQVWCRLTCNYALWCRSGGWVAVLDNGVRIIIAQVLHTSYQLGRMIIFPPSLTNSLWHRYQTAQCR